MIFTSDNGPRYEGRNLRRQGRKPELFDGGVNVPFIASWTSAGRARRDSVPRSLLDITPSLCALAGVTPPADLDGEDMSQLLLGRADPGRGPVFLFHRQQLWAMRSEQWKFHVLGILYPLLVVRVLADAVRRRRGSSGGVHGGEPSSGCRRPVAAAA